MSILGKAVRKLFGIAAVAGTAVAATQISEKIKENNPDGVPDANNNGKVDMEDYAAEIKKAAEELYGDKLAAAKDAVTNAVENPAETFEKAKEGAQELFTSVSEKVKSEFEDLKSELSGTAEEAAQTAETVEATFEEVTEAAEEAVEEVTE